MKHFTWFLHALLIMLYTPDVTLNSTKQYDFKCKMPLLLLYKIDIYIKLLNFLPLVFLIFPQELFLLSFSAPISQYHKNSLAHLYCHNLQHWQGYFQLAVNSKSVIGNKQLRICPPSTASLCILLSRSNYQQTSFKFSNYDWSKMVHVEFGVS